MGDCVICCEKFNKMKRKKITCPKCDYEICRECVETYLLGTHQDPHCMNCKHVWDREFLDSVCAKVFISKSLRTHRENILFEREKCMMPQTQPQVEKTLMVREMQKEIAQEEHRLRKLREELHDKYMTLDRLRNTRVATIEAAKFCRKCPVENCKGFLSTQWKCELCKNKICKECNEPEEEGHVCDPANVETTKLLAKDTKPCPSCGTMIFKISGCPQMWCTSCHVAFDWRTLRIEKGVIHNPHFFDFQRNNRNMNLRNPADIPCGGRPDWREISMFSKHIPQYQQRLLTNMIRLLSHIENWALTHEYPAVHRDNEDLRIAYMLNELAEKTFKHTIQNREKKNKKLSEFREVLQMFLNTAGDMLRQMIVDNSIVTSLENLEQLRGYVNEAMKKIGKRYNCMSPEIDRMWTNVIKT